MCMFKKLVLMSISFLAMVSCDKRNEEEKFVDNLLSQMTLEEKLGQMTLYSSGEDPTVPVFNPGFMDEISKGRCGAIFASISKDSIEYLQSLALKSRLKIPMIFGYDVIHGFETIFPIPLAEAASWNMELIKDAARASAVEATNRGINWFFGPMIDVARDARWGRVSEGAGEDPYLVSQVARAKVNGYQNGNLLDNTSVAACAKHFIAYGMPVAGRDYNTVIVSEQELKDVYLRPFDAAVEENVATVMSAFNEVNGVPCSANKSLLREYLLDERGFDGCVVTDFATIRELKNHGISESEEQSVDLALKAGVHIDMESALYKTDYVKESQIEYIDDAVRRILTLKYRLGLFDDPYRYCKQDEFSDYEKHLKQAYALASESVVLLKNKDNVLPISKEIKNIAVIGPMADNQADMLGTWVACGDTSDVVSILDGIRKEFPESNVMYSKGTDIDSDNASGFKSAFDIAKRSDVVIAVMGEKGDMAGEAASKGNIELPGNQTELLKHLHSAGKKVVLVLTNGRPLVLTGVVDYCDAIVEAWQLGTVAGTVVADVISGDINPSGKLPMTFPAHIAQVPIYYSQKNTGRPSDVNVRYTSRYLDIPFSPLFHFGYGLSYTSFEYSDMWLSSDEISKDECIVVNFKVKNTGRVEGKETVQLYVQDEVGSVTRPVRELKKFRKLLLQPGEEKTVSFKLYPEELKFANAEGERIVESGKYILYAGGDSKATLSKSFILK